MGSRRVRGGLIASIVAGTGLGALIGLVTGYLLTPRSSSTAGTRPSDALNAWREMVRKLSEQLQSGGSR